MATVLLLMLVVLGLNTIVWGLIGTGRVVASRLVAVPPASAAERIRPPAVAVLIAAHNEAVVIAETVRSALEAVPRGNVFVVSDGSTDRTAAIARRHGASVLELTPNRGKAGALVAGLEHYGLAERFDVVVFLDADTSLTVDYLTSGLMLFDDPAVVAVAGRAATVFDPLPPTWIGRLLVAYRERFYIAVQFLLKFGQAARAANAVSIVPGFASMYRSRVLGSIDIDVPGLAIEDFNMTFEVHAKHLGRIAFHPGCAIAYTQDPVTIGDYVRQLRRWNLGFWQTIRRHGWHRGRFWVALGFSATEIVVSSLVLVLVIPVGVTSFVVSLPGVAAPDPLEFVASALPPWLIAIGILVPDYLLTVLAVIVTRRRFYLVIGFAFPLVRILDAVICLWAISLAFRRVSDGRWSSPARRDRQTVTVQPDSASVGRSSS